MCKRNKAIPAVTAFFGFLIWFCLESQAVELGTFYFLEGHFVNPAYLEEPATGGINRTDVCTLFSGNVGPASAAGWDPGVQRIPPDTPNDGQRYLIQSSLGWPTPATLGWIAPDAPSGEPKTASEYYRKKGEGYLDTVEDWTSNYYESTNPADPNEIYLRFDFNPLNGASLPSNASLADELQEARESMRAFYVAWWLNPTLANPAIDGFLDVAFQLGTAFIMRGNLDMEKAFSVRFLEGIRNTSPGEEIYDELDYLGWDDIEEKLSGADGAYFYFNEASKLYLDIFGNPVTREWLIDRAPTRAFTQESSAFEEPVVVYDGYKDVGIMMRALAQRARVSDEVARRLVKLAGRRPIAATLIAGKMQSLDLEDSFMQQVFFRDGLPAQLSENYPSLNESFLSFRDARESMAKTHDMALNTRLNALGFDQDLALIVPGSNYPAGCDPFTYDWLRSKLLNQDGNPLGDLALSKVADENAFNTRKSFELKASNYLTEFDRISDEYNTQLVSICGADPDDPTQPNLEDPLDGGGLLEEQTRNVDVANNRIRRVLVGMDNVRARIEIEQERVAAVHGIMDRKAELIIDYGEKTETLTKEIGYIQADMVKADGLAAAASSINSNPFDLFGSGAAKAQAANAMFQARSQRRIAEKQAQLVHLQTMQQADFVFLDAQIIDIDSKAQIKSMALELNILKVDMLDAELLLAQEVDRLARYYTQIQEIIMRRDRAHQRLARRSFADPTYRIEVLNTALKAEDQFQVAQNWVYLTAKALEYKWPMRLSDLTDRIVPGIVRARTSSKTQDYLEDLNAIDSALSASHGHQLFYWNFSLRKDYLGMTFNKIMPDLGTTLTPVQQFQQYLLDLKGRSENLVDRDENGISDHLAVPFATVKLSIVDDDPNVLDLPDSEGNRRPAEGTPIFDNQLWDDKIDWIQVNIVGDGVYTHPSLMRIELWYGGTGFLRYLTPLHLGPNGEYIDYRAIPLPHYTMKKTVRGFNMEGSPYLKQAFTAKLVTEPREVPAEVYRSVNFREHPVASTDWRLLIPLQGTNFENIRDIEVIIVHRARTRL